MVLLTYIIYIDNIVVPYRAATYKLNESKFICEDIIGLGLFSYIISGVGN